MKKIMLLCVAFFAFACTPREDVIEDTDNIIGLWYFTDLTCYEDGEKFDNIRTDSEYILFETDGTGFIDSSPIRWERDYQYLMITHQITDETEYVEIKTLNDKILVLYRKTELPAYTWETFTTYRRAE